MANQFAQEGMNRILSDSGIDILKHASGVELLQTSRAAGECGMGFVVTPTSKELDNGVAMRLAAVLLDHRNFGHIFLEDRPAPQVGVRVKRGSATLDILLSVQFSSPTRPHQDVWVEIRDQGGKMVHQSGPICLEDPALQELTEQLLGK